MSRRFTKRIAICGSMSHFSKMRDVYFELQRENINSILPEEEFEIHAKLDKEDFEEFKRRVSFQYLRKIRDPQTFAILVINPQKHNIENYIGPNTFAEVAIAFAHTKKIYILYDFPEMYKEELSAWGAIALKDDLLTLIKSYNVAKSEIELQLSFFPQMD